MTVVSGTGLVYDSHITYLIDISGAGLVYYSRITYMTVVSGAGLVQRAGPARGGALGGASSPPTLQSS